MQLHQIHVHNVKRTLRICTFPLVHWLANFNYQRHTGAQNSQQRYGALAQRLVCFLIQSDRTQILSSDRRERAESDLTVVYYLHWPSKCKTSWDIYTDFWMRFTCVNSRFFWQVYCMLLYVFWLVLCAKINKPFLGGFLENSVLKM